jgi:hypothetical protein
MNKPSMADGTIWRTRPNRPGGFPSRIGSETPGPRARSRNRTDRHPSNRWAALARGHKTSHSKHGELGFAGSFDPSLGLVQKSCPGSVEPQLILGWSHLRPNTGLNRLLTFIGDSGFSIKQLSIARSYDISQRSLLVVWEAVNLDVFSDAPHVSKLVPPRAEEALYRLTTEPASGALH